MGNVIKQSFMSKTGITLIAILGLVVASNIPPLSILMESDDCKYSNSSGSFTFAETNFGGYDYDLCVNRFTEYKRQFKSDTVLYRLTSIKPLRFWNFREYLFDQKYHLPYRSWESIDRIRGPIRNKSGFQDF